LVLLHGGFTRGAELISKWADARKVPQIAFKPDFNRYPKAAPFKRNGVRQRRHPGKLPGQSPQARHPRQGGKPAASRWSLAVVPRLFSCDDPAGERDDHLRITHIRLGAHGSAMQTSQTRIFNSWPSPASRRRALFAALTEPPRRLGPSGNDP